MMRFHVITIPLIFWSSFLFGQNDTLIVGVETEIEEVDSGNYDCVYLEQPLELDSIYPLSISDSIVLHTFWPNEDADYPSSEIDEDVFLLSVIEQSLTLNLTQTENVFDILFNYKTTKFGTDFFETMCYNPHHVFVFYDNGKAIDYLELCVGCEKYKTHIKFDLDFCPEKWCMLYHYFNSVGLDHKFLEDVNRCK
jgi:hypothetical protein